MRHESQLKIAGAAALTIALSLLPLRATGADTTDMLQVQARSIGVDSFLRIDGIEGESTDDRHKGEVEVLSWTVGDSQSGGTGSGAGAAAGRVSMQDFRFTATPGTSSPLLFVACANGRHIREAILSQRKSGGGRNQQDYLIVRMSDVVITSYQTGATDGNPPMDRVSLSFSTISFEYRPQNPDGTMGAPVKGGWDVRANREM